jgi:hypothetical protein
VGFCAVVSSFEKGVFSARCTSILGGSHFFQRMIWWVRVGCMEMQPVILSKSSN